MVMPGKEVLEGKMGKISMGKSSTKLKMGMGFIALGGRIVLFCSDSANTVCWVSTAPEKHHQVLSCMENISHSQPADHEQLIE